MYVNKLLATKLFLVIVVMFVSIQQKTGTDVSSSKSRAVVLLKRTLVYFCQDFRESFKNVLLRKIQDLKKDILSFKKEVGLLKT